MVSLIEKHEPVEWYDVRLMFLIVGASEIIVTIRS